MAQSTKPKSATSYKDTSFGILPRSKVVELETEAVKKAQEYIVKLSERKTPITPQLIRDVHKEGFGFIFPDCAGHFRTINVAVGEYEPPHYSRIKELIQNFVVIYWNACVIYHLQIMRRHSLQRLFCF